MSFFERWLSCFRGPGTEQISQWSRAQDPRQVISKHGIPRGILLQLNNPLTNSTRNGANRQHHFAKESSIHKTSQNNNFCGSIRSPATMKSIPTPSPFGDKRVYLNGIF